MDKNWDVINISFAEPEKAGSTDGKMKFDISGLTSDYTKDDFKKDVKSLQAQGKKIVLSIGGYEGYFSLTSDNAVNQFVSDIKSIINEYGFDGIDIDLEQSSVQFESGNDKDINNPTSPKVVNMIKAIRTICCCSCCLNRRLCSSVLSQSGNSNNRSFIKINDWLLPYME